jgi:hypothetical protein
MKRHGNLWQHVISFEALRRAAEASLQGQALPAHVADTNCGRGTRNYPRSPTAPEPTAASLSTSRSLGNDDKTTTKIAAGVILHDGAEPIMKRWVATDVTTSPKVQQELQDFFLQHWVKQVAMSQGNLGCPHEEGEDFPHGEDCPFCPFWKGKQGSSRRD